MGRILPDGIISIFFGVDWPDYAPKGEENMSQSRAKLSTTQIVIVVLTVLTAVLHLVLGVRMLNDMLGILFILNFIGYLALVVGLYFVPQLAPQRSLIRYALIAFTAVTVIAWVFVGTRGAGAYIDKVIEIAMIVLLYQESRA